MHLGIAESSVYQMRVAIRLFERWRGAPVRTSELTDDLLRRFLSAYSTGHARATVNGKRRFLLALWRCAVDNGLATVAPSRVPRMPEPYKLPEAWTVDEIGRIISESRREPGEIAAIPARRFWPSLLLTKYYCGERIGALLHVPLANLSMDHRGMVVPGEVRKNRRERWCSLPDDAIAACAAILNPTREFVWPWPWSREWLEQKFKTILKRAGVRYGRGKGGLFNKIRRSSGSIVDAAGGDGSRLIGNGRGVFERYYRDPRIADKTQEQFLPKPSEPEDTSPGNQRDRE